MLAYSAIVLSLAASVYGQAATTGATIDSPSALITCQPVALRAFPLAQAHARSPGIASPDALVPFSSSLAQAGLEDRLLTSSTSSPVLPPPPRESVFFTDACLDDEDGLETRHRLRMS